MIFRSKLLQRRAAGPGITLNKIYDVYVKPDGRVEGEGEDIWGDARPKQRDAPQSSGFESISEKVDGIANPSALVFSRFFDGF
jgi:hypothetical protein